VNVNTACREQLDTRLQLLDQYLSLTQDLVHVPARLPELESDL